MSLFFNLFLSVNYLIFNWLIIHSQIEGIMKVCLLNNNLLPSLPLPLGHHVHRGGGLLSHRLVFFLNGTITSKQNAFSFQKPVWGSKEFRSFVFMPTDYPWATVRAVRLVLWCESSSKMI